MLARAVLADVRRFRWLVAIVVVLALGAGVAATLLAPPTYAARASLIVSSTYRSPDQDAVLVQGYVELFDEAYQDGVVDDADLGPDVELSARSAAASPIMVVEATASDREVAAEAATTAATAFQSDVNEVRSEEREQAMAELQNRLRARVQSEGPGSSAVSQLREELLRIQSDRTNELQTLQSAADVETVEPSPVRTMGLALVGGLGLGVVLALGCGWLQRRGRRR